MAEDKDIERSDRSITGRGEVGRYKREQDGSGEPDKALSLCSSLLPPLCWAGLRVQ